MSFLLFLMILFENQVVIRVFGLCDFFTFERNLNETNIKNTNHQIMTNYNYDGSLQQNISFSTMVAAAFSHQGGPQAVCSQPIDVYVDQATGVAVPFDGTTTRYVAIPLLTCAAVIFASDQSATAYLYHALSGTVSQQTFNTAMAAIGPVPLTSVYVIYTFPNPSDSNYMADANGIANYGIPTANIIYAPDLLGSSFGITSQTIIG